MYPKVITGLSVKASFAAASAGSGAEGAKGAIYTV
jgi:hypothetical protein